jgi:hypothetical protein
MLDFTNKRYSEYLKAIKRNFTAILRFDEYFKVKNEISSFCLIRHDVDRKPLRALKMARLESRLGIKSTYYFRAKPNTFKPHIIKEIYDLGHEIGYHYESLSDAKGDFANAVKDFEKNLIKFREIVPVNTCAMHSRPFLPYDNRDIWRIEENHEYLKQYLGLSGEVYLDIDYTDVAYITDVGRNWSSWKSNLRDKVNSNIMTDFETGKDLLDYLTIKPHFKLCFQVHPERWASNYFIWLSNYFLDSAINFIKIYFLAKMRTRKLPIE